MNKYEALLDQAVSANIEIVEEYTFNSERIKGLYCDGLIALNHKLHNTAEKNCVLAEEIGHHLTSSGDIVELNAVMARKQELVARMWAYNNRIGLCGIIKAFEHGCQSAADAAELLGVTEQFFSEAAKAYTNKYGTYKELDNYVIFFEPSLSVMKKFI